MSLAKKLEELANPAPSFADPQDLDFDAARPVLVDFEDELDSAPDVRGSSLRRINAVELTQADQRYQGKKTSRKSLANYESASDDDDSDTGNDLKSAHDASLKTFDSFDSSSDVEANDMEIQRESSESSQEHDDDDEDGADVNAELDDEEYISDDDQEKTEATVSSEDTLRTFSNLNLEENAEKGAAVKEQLKLWDSLLECRIKLQKVLLAANVLPQYDVWQDFWKSDVDSRKIIRDSQKSIKSLLDSLLQLQSSMLSSNKELHQLMNANLFKSSHDDSDEDISSDGDQGSAVENKSTKVHVGMKRKLKFPEYNEYLKKLHLDYEAPRNSIIQKWDDKTKVSAGRLKKSFVGFEQSALQQIQQILSDKDRLISRTQLKRSIYQVLGKKQDESEGNVAQVSYHEAVLKQDSHLNDYDKEIFDDNDFYHQLLRELIEHKTADVNDSNTLGRQWLEIQRLRSKMKKKVDTRASKGRKLRFDVHPKLVGFMAPNQQSSMTDLCRKELFGSLFGNQVTSSVPLESDGVKLYM